MSVPAAIACSIRRVEGDRYAWKRCIYHAVKGRTLDQKRALVRTVTDAVVKNFAVPVEAVTVEIVPIQRPPTRRGSVQ